MASIETGRKNSRDRLWQALQSLEPLLALLMVTLGFALADQVWGQGRFSELRNFRVVLVQAAPVAVAALGMTLIIISGGIDLSAGTASMLCATVLAAMLSSDYSISVAISCALLTGAVCGLINGLLIGLLHIPPFIVTLGTMTIFLGFAKRVAGGSTVFVDRQRMPQWLNDLSSTMPPDWQGWLPRIASGVWLAVAIALLVATVLRYSVFGRHLFAIGSNESTARLCGINILSTKVFVYVLGGTAHRNRWNLFVFTR